MLSTAMIRILVWLALAQSLLAFQQKDILRNRGPPSASCLPSRTHRAVGSSRIRELSRLQNPRDLVADVLFLSSANNGSEKGGDRPRRRLPNPIKAIKKGANKMLKARARLTARFQGLSRRAKRIVVAYVFLVTFAFGSLARNVVINRSGAGAQTPIEISYSSFLDLVDGQAVDSNYNTPSMDQVRIGNDRIVYRLYNNPEKSSTGDSTKNNLPLELPSLSGRAAQKLAQQRGTAAQPYLSAFTRQIPDQTPPQLLQQLRERDISFAAAPQPRTSTLALAVRTFMIAFYFVILFRLYKTVSGAGGGGKNETPGKLAQTSDLPMASFDEIQGIDGAKVEVMELVDSLRNPDKYAILGARAPTGLLLVGPPGTGACC